LSVPKGGLPFDNPIPLSIGRELATLREPGAYILDIEMNLHVKLCAGWGLSPSDLEQIPVEIQALTNAQS
jgi:hypothetical protein